MPKNTPKRLLGLELTSTRLLAVVMGAIIVLSAGAFVWAKYDNNQSGLEEPAESSDTSPDGSNSVNLNPPTDEEISETEQHKQQLAQNDNQSSGTASVVITEASGSVVRAYVSGVFEDGGTCTATATQDSQTKSGASTGFKNVSYTQCPPIYWNLPPGSWTVTVEYKSDSTSGKQTTNIKI